jgi:CheY-like chemotaxis protein
VSLQGSRILVLSDCPIQNQVLKEDLHRMGAVTDSACSREEAMGLLLSAQEPFRVVVVDSHQDNHIWLSFGKLVRQNPAFAGVSLVILTAAGLRGDCARFQEAGYSAYLTRPIRQQTLWTVLGSVAPDTSTMLTRHQVEPKVNRKLSVLVADDNEVNQRVFGKMLRKMGHDAEIVSSGRLAIERLQAGGFDIVLMDCHMPDIDGYEATRTIRTTGKNIPILALTASTNTEDRLKALDSGMTTVLSKPIRADTLQEALDRYL